MAAIVLVLCLTVAQISARLNGEGIICGKSLGGPTTLEEKVVGGYDVGYFKYPWFAALLESENNVACGGTLIGSRSVITAAHCFKEYLDKNKTAQLETVFQVVLGIYNKCEKEKTQKIYDVEKVNIHEQYMENVPYYDIALLTLKEKATNYTPICLTKSAIKNRPKEGTTPGLGTLKYHGATPCVLQEARLLIYPDSECKNMLNKTENDPSKLFRAFCAGYLQGGIDTCQGDSGGPLQIVDEFGSHILLGVVSFGFQCATPGMLGIYTDASQYIDWIEKKTGFPATLSGDNSSLSAATSNKEPYLEQQTPAAVPAPPHHHKFVRPQFMRPLHIIIYRNKKRNETRKQNFKSRN